MKRLIAGLLVTAGFAVMPALAQAGGPPDEPAGGTPASCAGIAFSDHATGNADTTMRQVIHEEVPAILELTGLSKGELTRMFVQFHAETHQGCEDALISALMG